MEFGDRSVPASRPEWQFIPANEVHEMLAKRQQPRLGNGWRFVFDRRAGARIPNDAFTGYGIARQIPLMVSSDAPHMLRHDGEHVPAYQILFSSETFAGTLQRAARNANSYWPWQRQYASHLDGLGDIVRRFTTDAEREKLLDNYTEGRQAFAQMRHHVLQLVTMDMKDAPAEEHQLARRDEIWEELGFGYYEAELAARHPEQTAREHGRPAVQAFTYPQAA